MKKSLALTAAILALSADLYAGVHIGGWSFSANGQLARNYQYTGACPVQLEFHWGVIGTGPGPVTYYTTRNDGAKSQTQSITLPSANRSIPIVTTWQLGAPTPQFQPYRGWVQVHILSPNPVTHKIAFTINCQ